MAVNSIVHVIYHCTQNDCNNGWGDSPGDGVAGVIIDGPTGGVATIHCWPRNGGATDLYGVAEGTDPGEYTIPA